MSTGETAGTRIRAERARRGWSQNELARRAGVSQALISFVESGQRASIETLEAVAQELGLSPSSICPAKDHTKQQILKAMAKMTRQELARLWVMAERILSRSSK